MKNKIKIAIYFFAKYCGLFALARHITRKKIRILCYHGGSIGDECQYNGKLFMTRHTFEQRVDWLQANGFNISSLTEAVHHAKSWSNRPNLLNAFTFDDGWYSTGKELLPVLAERNLPSTLYLCTKHFEEGWPIFTVTVRYILWKSRQAKIVIEGFSTQLDGTYDLQNPASKNELILKAVDWLNQNATSREQAMSALHRFAACADIGHDALDVGSRRFNYLTGDELSPLVGTGCSIELHGHVHAYPVGFPDKFYQDVVDCKEIIVKLGLPEPKHYCYPSGDFDQAASTVLQNLEIASATTCLPGLIGTTKGTDQFYLPRFLDGESIHMLEFEAEMSGFADLLRRRN